MCILYDGVVSRQEPDEYVQIRNDEPYSVQMQGWVLTDLDDDKPVFTFPKFVLEAGEVIRVYTNEVHPDWGGLSFGNRSAIWNNSSPDIAGLLDPAENIVSQKTYPPGCEE